MNNPKQLLFYKDKNLRRWIDDESNDYKCKSKIIQPIHLQWHLLTILQKSAYWSNVVILIRLYQFDTESEGIKFEKNTSWR